MNDNVYIVLNVDMYSKSVIFSYFLDKESITGAHYQEMIGG